MAAERRTKGDLEAIRAAYRGLESLPKRPSVDELVAHRRFHTAIYTASHNELFINTLETLWDKADRYRRLALERDRQEDARETTAREHARLVELVTTGDSVGAAQVMREHVEASLGAVAAWRLGREEPTAG